MIPKSIHEVTADWLSDVLNDEIRSASPTQIGQGIGLLGDIYRVELDSNSSPASVVVKLPSSFEENRAQGVSLGMFEAEIRFYNEIAHEATVGLPKVFHTDIVPGTADFVIIMEDLTDLTMVQQSIGMNVEQAKAAVQVLASIHAVWWDRVQTEAFEWIPSMVGPRIEFVDQMLAEIFPAFSEGFAQYLTEEGLAVFEKFSSNYLNVNKELAGRSPWTLAHQDYRVENMLFGPSGSGQVVVLDWQGIGRGPGVYDLAYILGGSMDTELRRVHEATLVRAYYDRLIECGIQDYSYDQLWKDYGLAHLQGGLATSLVTGGAMDLSNERGLELIATMASRHAMAALDHDGLNLLSALS
jgi:aminoglycoside/choline kinase family phosphotransferase